MKRIHESLILRQGSELGASEDTKIELSTNTIYKNPADSYTRFPVKNVEELYEITGATGCVIIAKVLRIVTDQGWYYMICYKRKSKAIKSQTTNCYTCERCDEEVSDVYPSMLNKHYVLKVQISGYNLDNYHIFTANKITDDEDVMKSVIVNSTLDEGIFEDENTHSENKDQDKKHIADAERPSSEVGIKRKQHVENTKIIKIAKINED
ncbi:hypothetical protein Tco_0072104 [Tanacetum coccineum]